MVTIDNGSTFTDGCLFADGRLHAVKVLTTPYDLMRCFIDVFRALARQVGLPNEAELLRRVEEVRYSTTSGTNALLVRRGSRVGAIVGPEGLPDLYGVRTANPELVDAILGDRVASLALGEASDEEADARILSAIRTLLGRGAQWVVVSLPSPRGAAEERRVKKRLLTLLPSHLLGAVPVLFSRELCADPDDARRTATALLNGFLHREMARFLYHADGWVREHHVSEPLRILRNDGGCGRVAKTTAVKTLDSGPRGGLAGGARIAAVAGRPRWVTLDVGGTSSDIGIVENGEPAIEPFGIVHGLRTSFSFPRLKTAALGGGSVFRVEAGAIRIGPESAGALPGPASFGRGGEDPTLTDAAFLLGYLDPATFAGGSIAIRLDLAERAVLERVARPLHLSDATAAARAMMEAFADCLAAEILRTCERFSYRPEETPLLAYGGSGPLVAAHVARCLGTPEWIVPETAACFSALGVGFVPLAHEQRAILPASTTAGEREAVLRELSARVERDMFGEGIPDASLRTVRAYGASRGREGPDPSVPAEELVLDVRLERPRKDPDVLVPQEAAARDDEAPTIRRVWIDGTFQEVPVVGVEARRRLGSGAGPAVLDSPWWTALVPPGFGWRAEPWGIRIFRETTNS
jgi:N-methylhydantoinase A/oxoprolinase/acetone carboxylase beta subunit